MNHYIGRITVTLLLILLLNQCTPLMRRQTLAPSNARTASYSITNSQHKNLAFQPQKHYEYNEAGKASYYGIRDKFHCKLTATGELFDAHSNVAAHRTLPLPSIVRVINLENGRSTVVKIIDRGPYPGQNKLKERIIDVSMGVARKLGFYQKGTARVRVISLARASYDLAKSYPSYRQNLQLAKKHQNSRKCRPYIKKRKQRVVSNKWFAYTPKLSPYQVARNHSIKTNDNHRAIRTIKIRKNQYVRNNLHNQEFNPFQDNPQDHISTNKNYVDPLPSLMANQHKPRLVLKDENTPLPKIKPSRSRL